MIRPKPFTLKCKKCGWSKRFSPKSDALIIGIDTVNECPKCGNKDLVQKAAENRFFGLFNR